MKPLMISLVPVAVLAVTGPLSLGSWPASAGHGDHHDPRVLAEHPHQAEGPIAPRLTGLGDNRFPVTTESEAAQRFFDQGLLLTYGFNHQEAVRTFKEAARLDPELAMAYWGWALALGPNLNLSMSLEGAFQAHEAIQLALERSAEASDKERALIEALAERYSDDPEAERPPLDAAYADAMAEVYRRFPRDADVATLYADALMNTSPWNYWTPEGHPREVAEAAAEVLESAMDLDPDHEGALHYYIHLFEPVDPWRAEKAADRLRGLAPGAGHLVHMPSHIYMQVGRYHEAFEANARASEADESYISQCLAQGIYPLSYYPHNVHFLVWAGAMEGRSAETLAAARKVATRVPADGRDDVWALYDTFSSMPLSAMVRFGLWDEILAEPEPPAHRPFWRGVWHHARGMALLRTAGVRAASKELKSLDRLKESAAAQEAVVGFSSAATLLTLARELLTAEILAEDGDHERAVGHAERALRLEEGQMYNEPPAWFAPVRHTLGALLLESGLPREAETVYYQDLRENPENGYALYGLWQALVAQGRHQEALEARERHEAAWKEADIQLTGSRF